MKHTPVLFLSLLFFVVIPVRAETETPPNIIFILADDLGWQDVGFMGSRYFETPRLDQLASEGLVLTNAFMYPTCSPSRAALLTGKQSFRTGCYTVPVLEKGRSQDNIFSRWTVGAEHELYSGPLNREGYKLIHLGKWHIVGPDPSKEDRQPFSKKLTQPKNGDLSWLEAHRSPEIRKFYPEGRGFHENVGGTWWGDPARGYDKGYNAPGGGYRAPFKNPFIEERPDGDPWLTDRLTSDAIDFIDRHREGPFFVNLHYYSPHRPSVPQDEESLNHFLAKPADPETGQGGSKKNRREIASYATMIRSIDENVGRLMDHLESSGLQKRTVIIFTSDNGFNGLQSTNQNLRGAKGNVYDGGLRVPAVIHWPGVVQPRRADDPVHGVDYFPTFLELAGVTDFEGTLDGDSLGPLLRGESLPERSIFWHLASTYKDRPCSVIRRGDWKLIQFLHDGRTELYQTTDDSDESEELSESHPERVAEMLEQLTDWRRRNKVPLPPSSPLQF